MKQKIATLGMGLIATKGSATPVGAVAEAVKAVEVKVDISTPKDDRTAVTVRLDRAMYRNLKMHGLENKISNQDIIVAALKDYLK